MLDDLMGKLGEAQSQMDEAKKKLDTIFVTAEVEGGLVKVTANANKQVTNIEISDDIVGDKDALEDLILTALNKALEKADEKNNEEMQKIAKDMLPPGLF